MSELLYPNWRFLGQGKRPKGWKVALLWISVVRPVGRTNLTLQEDQLSGTEGSSWQSAHVWLC